MATPSTGYPLPPGPGAQQEGDEADYFQHYRPFVPATVHRLQLTAHLTPAFGLDGGVELLLNTRILPQRVVQKQPDFHLAGLIGCQPLVQIVLNPLHSFQFGSHPFRRKIFRGVKRKRICATFPGI